MVQVLSILVTTTILIKLTRLARLWEKSNFWWMEKLGEASPSPVLSEFQLQICTKRLSFEFPPFSCDHPFFRWFAISFELPAPLSPHPHYQLKGLHVSFCSFWFKIRWNEENGRQTKPNPTLPLQQAFEHHRDHPGQKHCKDWSTKAKRAGAQGGKVLLAQLV